MKIDFNKNTLIIIILCICFTVKQNFGLKKTPRICNKIKMTFLKDVAQSFIILSQFRNVVKKNGKTNIVFIEAKKTQLNLHDLGQLWAYCKLCDPLEAFLLSSANIGSLDKIFNHLLRTDLLDFGDGKRIKRMQVGKWDVSKNCIDYSTLIPKF